jgi:conjugal transfer/entry exclusion protein
MKPFLRTVLLTGLFVCLAFRQSQAQLPVIDLANLGQTTITAVESVLIVANQLLELTPLDSIDIQDTFASDFDDLHGIVTEGTALMGDITSLQAQMSALFDLTTAPDNSTALAQRLSAIRQAVFLARSYALRTQALIRTLNNTARHLEGLVAAIGDYVGNLQSAQSVNQSLAEINKTHAVLTTQTAAYQHADVMDKMEAPLLIESLRKMHAAQYADWPGYQP